MRRLRTAAAGVLLLCLLLLPASLAQDRDTSKHVAGLDMTKSTLNVTLKAMPADAKVLMEFYATWCPACRCVSND
jgi:thiol:disulfide interchange protein